MNQGPPIFVSELNSTLDILAGVTSTYKLPSILDPDSEDTFQAKVQLNDAIAFSSFDQKSLSFTFNPDLKLTKSDSTYLIKIVLEDNNPYPKSSTYSLAVKIHMNQTQIANTTEE